MSDHKDFVDLALTGIRKEFNKRGDRIKATTRSDHRFPGKRIVHFFTNTFYVGRCAEYSKQYKSGYEKRFAMLVFSGDSIILSFSDDMKAFARTIDWSKKQSLDLREQERINVFLLADPKSIVKVYEAVERGLHKIDSYTRSKADNYRKQTKEQIAELEEELQELKEFEESSYGLDEALLHSKTEAPQGA